MLRVIADMHIHGSYSRATSERMCVEEIARFAKIKGLNIVGTGARYDVSTKLRSLLKSSISNVLYSP
jgi:PHP family Zn ribbon phosphoesterase